MDVNRIFICHAIRRENWRDTQKLHYLMEALKRAGLEILTDQDNDSAQLFFPQLQQKLLTCQALILLQTPEAISAPRVLLAVRAAQRLAKQKSLQIFRLIYSLGTENAIPQEWKVLTTFDGTHDYQQTSEKIVSAIAANATPKNTTREAVMRGASLSLHRTPSQKMPAQTTSEWQQKLPSQTTGSQPQVLPAIGAEPSPRTLTRTAGRGGRNLLMLTFISFFVLLIVGSAGTLFFLNSSTKSTSLTPSPRPVTGQISFTSSDQIGTNYNTGICDEIQVNLNQLIAPKTGNSYYAWLLPDRRHSEDSTALFVGRLTVNNGAVSMTYTNPTHENLLLTKSRFLITEESTSSPPSIPSPDQHVWRYSAAIPQTPNPQDLQSFSYLDHIRHLLAKEPTLQDLGMQGGLGTWFYENVKSVREWANTAQDASKGGKFGIVRSNAVSILDYLDGTDFVAGDVPLGTPMIADPQISRVPILSQGQDPANQIPPSYIHHIEIHLQGLTDSPDITDVQRTLTSKISNELTKINGHLEQVRQDAKQLANMSNTQIASSATSLLTDLTENANSALMGQSDPAKNIQQGGTTWIYNAMRQLATFDAKEAL